ncbi:MAG: NTF2-like N-terminal transpeptidase domain-containing protein [Bacillota bacterium]
MTILVLTATLAAGCGGGQDPKTIMQTYLDAMVKGDYPTAYAQLTTKAKGEVTADDFAKAMKAEAESKGPVVRFEIKNVNPHGATSTIITATVYRKKGSDAETSDTKQYGFVIDSGQGWRLGNY